MEPDETPRQLGEDDELPDDLGSRIGDTLTFGGSGSYIRTISADEASRRLAPRKLTDLDASEIDKAIAFAKGYMTATGELGPEPGGVLDSRPRRRGLNRLIPTGRGPEHPVECHEVWRYDDRTHVQMLVRMIALCPACHQVKHLGFANVKGKGTQARAHLARVNGWTLELEGLRPYVLGNEYAHIVRQAAIPPERRGTE